MQTLSLSLLLLALVSGCANIGRPFEFTGPQEIVIGQTTQKEVMRRFGEPFREGWDSGDVQWTYGQYRYDLFGNSNTKDLVVTFDKNGVVKSYNYNASTQDGKVKVLALEKDTKDATL